MVGILEYYKSQAFRMLATEHQRRNLARLRHSAANAAEQAGVARDRLVDTARRAADAVTDAAGGGRIKTG
ncbi:hypothetical protein [Tanticharoenia sakaeratensis]|jgi:hypothetical protein|uniref:Uncharacterized protein n=1 Tax=Tanticharoenia sakaeratensis NBRC 103193 TaxID=1231623 RepID=A0A0D6MQ17_9PROT|nr:hypothetical protein [Tanticharoenia sakaeratensis]GAN55546.1 hypothetical protein Tasa_048_171 [Tanticharoenia sakaeratensis NBRC 103193]GBQ21768.1 hypothetical protein AA103193_1841 [Tanticharoenia sakaeratensis NBRC 103193]